MSDLSEFVARKLSLDTSLVEQVLLCAIRRIADPTENLVYGVNDQTQIRRTNGPNPFVDTYGVFEGFTEFDIHCLLPTVSLREGNEVGPQPDQEPKPLPEFKLTLTRVPEGETAYPMDPESEDFYHDYGGRRSKFGGKPDHSEFGEPMKSTTCTMCGNQMSFIAQIDSIEHESEDNPNAVSSLPDEQRWMFGEVNLLYVYYCFQCSNGIATL